jgi:hypothetical protein
MAKFLNGNISLQSNYGFGTTFKLTLMGALFKQGENVDIQ